MKNAKRNDASTMLSQAMATFVAKRALPVVLALLMALFATFALYACSGGGQASRVSAPVSAKDAVNDYSWSELSSISSEIAAAGSDEAALAVAKRYHLANEDGTLDGSQYKEVELESGLKTRVLVAGFNHDATPGGGKAGISFVFADAVALRGMNNNGGFDETSIPDDFDVIGGWNASELRGWLNGDFASELPADLQAALADVVKRSLVVPAREQELDDTGTLLSSVDSLVGEGTDRLWIPALAEVSGVKDNSPTAKESPEWTAPLKAEGSQYQLFHDAVVSERSANGVLVRALAGGDGAACRWWLRSAEDWTYAQVLADGFIDRRDDTPTAPTPQGVVPCFAI